MENLGIHILDHLVYFIAIGNIYGHLVYFVAIWYIFPRFGILYLEKSGNPDRILRMSISISIRVQYIEIHLGLAFT
jgi:hypothetical protein